MNHRAQRGKPLAGLLGALPDCGFLRIEPPGRLVETIGATNTASIGLLRSGA
ncbi:MAG: hypothetical protein ABI662_10320 [Dermatophilaceae bacterium]